MPLIAAYDYRSLAGLGVTNPNPPLVSAIAAAVKQEEGFYPGSAAYRYNNPGNLMDPDHRIWPQYPTVPGTGEVIFPTLAAGEAALENDLSIKINRGMTLTSLFNMYAPASAGNDPVKYAADVAIATGVDPNTPLNQVGYGAPVSFDTAGPTVAADQPAFDLAPFDDSPVAMAPDITAAGMMAPPSGAFALGLGAAALVLYFLFVD